MEHPSLLQVPKETQTTFPPEDAGWERVMARANPGEGVLPREKLRDVGAHNPGKSQVQGCNDLLESWVCLLLSDRRKWKCSNGRERGWGEKAWLQRAPLLDAPNVPGTWSSGQWGGRGLVTVVGVYHQVAQQPHCCGGKSCPAFPLAPPPVRYPAVSTGSFL